MLGKLDQKQIDQLLRNETVGRIGVHADGRTFVVPTTYVYDGDAIYGHAAEGLKIRMMRTSPPSASMSTVSTTWRTGGA